jgi:hypothetical protein
MRSHHPFLPSLLTPFSPHTSLLLAIKLTTRADGMVIYMGKDKMENEKLLKYGWPEDVWFHVDDLSSAHVYLRMTEVRRANCYFILI